MGGLRNLKVINREDYERYLIPLAPKVLAGKQRKKLIYRELEKRHPCFSDSFCFDARLGIGKEGLFSDVVVMNKLKLAEYEKRVNRAWSGFFIENCKVPRFVSKRLKNLFTAVFCLVLLGTGIYVIQFLKRAQGELLKQKQTEISETEETVNEEKESVETAENQVSLTESFFKAVELKKGKISSFIWKTDGFTERLEAKLVGLYPEDCFAIAGDFELSSVKYVNGTPELNFTARKRSGSSGGGNEAGGGGMGGGDKADFCITEGQQLKSSDYRTEIRRILLENDCEITEENFGKYSVSFLLKDFSVFSLLERAVEQFSAGFTEIKLTVNEKSQAVVELSVEKAIEGWKGFRLESLSSFQECFALKKIEKAAKVSEIGKKIEPQKNENLKKIGEVKYENGNSLIFYKDENGKIIKKLEAK